MSYYTVPLLTDRLEMLVSMDLSNQTIIVGVWCLAISAVLYYILSSVFSDSGDTLEITQLYVYPVKGLRGCALSKAHIGPYGIVGDRTFCLQQVHRDEDDKSKKVYKTVFIGRNLELALFSTLIEYQGTSENAEDAEVVVTWNGRGTEFDKKTSDDTEDTIRFPLQPSHYGRKEIEVDLHTSRTKAYDMGDALSTWFAERLGFEVRLVHIGDGSRPVLGSLAPSSKAALKRARLATQMRALVPFLAQPAEERLAFNDIAHYLVVTEESVRKVASRLRDGCEVDVTKFRPNVVVRGAVGPFVEDFWGEVTFEGGIQMPLTANCFRCQSITVDYETGRVAAGEGGMVLKRLMKDRRVDAGAKYSPVFGRYGYCFGSSFGKVLRVGQGGRVTHVNAERTVFDWILN